jgi:hypothetical protein
LGCKNKVLIKTILQIIPAVIFYAVIKITCQKNIFARAANQSGANSVNQGQLKDGKPEAIITGICVFICEDC